MHEKVLKAGLPPETGSSSPGAEPVFDTLNVDVTREKLGKLSLPTHIRIGLVKRFDAVSSAFIEPSDLSASCWSSIMNLATSRLGERFAL
jgi:hypothetical protein